MIAGLEDIDAIECVTSLLLRRQVLNRLQVNLVVFKDRNEIRCQIPYETYKSINAIITLGL
jgi:type III secretion system FlhB-like substrate exporter